MSDKEKVNVLIFPNQIWQEIPDQDNPAMDPNRTNCLMIFKGSRDTYAITYGGFVVANVEPKQDITKLGVFWRLEDAIIFADRKALLFSAD